MNVNGVSRAVALGVPEIVPLVDSARPAGSTPLVSVQTSGAVPPVALNVAVYGCPAHPFGSAVVVMLRAGSAGGDDDLPQLHNSVHNNVSSRAAADSTIGRGRSFFNTVS